jgi:hypothetical protein
MDIFISYARKDDRCAREVIGSKGLVTSLHDRLILNFEELGEPRPSIFRDTKQISGADQFEPRLGAALAKAKLLVVVLSRNWVESEWCRRELDTFVKRCQERNESGQAIKERIFLVRKHAIAPKDRPEWLQGQSGYDLFQVDPENGDEIEFFDSDVGKPHKEEWFTNTRRLAKDLRRRFGGSITDSLDITQPSARLPAAVMANPVTVFVARPAADMERCYGTLLEELLRRGARIVPDVRSNLPMQADQAIAFIDAALEQAAVSIHLLGEKPGFQPEDGDPIVQLQLERAARMALKAHADGRQSRSFHRVIWAPRVIPGSPAGAPAREIFEVLAKHSPGRGPRPESSLCNGDKIDGDTLTKFVQFLLRHLEEISRPPQPQVRGVAAGAQVYIQHDAQDIAAAETVAEGLVKLGFTPVLPVIEGDSAGRSQIHRDSLKMADVVVLCWANAGGVWVRATASELRDWQLLGRSKAFASRTVVALPPPVADKARMRRFPPKTDIDRIIDASALTDVQSDALAPLLQDLIQQAP